MTVKWQPACVAVVVAVVTGITPQAALAADIPRVGAEAPGFTLIDNEGRATSLDDLRGNWVVLYFYPKDSCASICRLEAIYFQRHIAQYHEAGAVVIGVSPDTAQSHRALCAREGLTFKLLSDSDRRAADTYGSVGEYNGSKYTIRNTFVIDPSGRIARVFLNVNVVGHSEETLAALVELQKQRQATSSAEGASP